MSTMSGSHLRHHNQQQRWQKESGDKSIGLGETLSTSHGTSEGDRTVPQSPPTLRAGKDTPEAIRTGPPAARLPEKSASVLKRDAIDAAGGGGRLRRLAWLSMILLVIQGTAMSVVLRVSRMAEGRPYLPSVSVLLSEVIKLAICLTVKIFDRRGNDLLVRLLQPELPGLPTVLQQPSSRSEKSSPNNDGSAENSGVASRGRSIVKRRGLVAPLLSLSKRKILSEAFRHALPMALPAGMFASQQVLLIAAATYLDAVTYQILNQASKLIPTAVFARILLGQRLLPLQWASIPVLAGGVVLVTLNNNSASSSGSSHSINTMHSENAVSFADWMFGMVACLIAGISSAFAGVYFEKYVKGRHAASLWTRNVQLGMFAVPFCILYASIRDGEKIHRYGWLQGFTLSAWIVVLLQVFGGLVIGMVTKYTSSVLKNFALAISVILTVLVAIPLFDQWPSIFFLFGVTLVLSSVFMYSNGAANLGKESGSMTTMFAPMVSASRPYFKCVTKLFHWMVGTCHQNRLRRHKLWSIVVVSTSLAGLVALWLIIIAFLESAWLRAYGRNNTSILPWFVSADTDYLENGP